ncbi:MAG TPA: hypothetical protein PL110_03805 [Candidatus Eremiobacteraeota bacterium]|nr:hypothetical protein [Candidatus Eremiobacteraeota bacterium]
MSEEEKRICHPDGRIKYIDTPEGRYKFNYTEDKELDVVLCPDDSKYEFFYGEEGEIDCMETPYGTLNFFYTRSGKLDSINVEGIGEFVFYYDDNDVQIEIVGEIDEILENELRLFGIL